MEQRVVLPGEIVHPGRLNRESTYDKSVRTTKRYASPIFCVWLRGNEGRCDWKAFRVKANTTPSQMAVWCIALKKRDTPGLRE